MPAMSTPPRPSSFNAPPMGRRAGAEPAFGGRPAGESPVGPSPDARRPYMSAALLFMAGVATLLYSMRQGVLIGQIAAPILTLGAIHGLWRGGFRKIMLLGVTVGLLYLVFSYPAFAEPLVRKFAGDSSGLVSGLITVAAAVVAYLISMSFISRFRRRHIANRVGRLRLDRVLGAGIGFVEGALIVLAVCWTVVMVRPQAALVLDRREVAVDSFQHRAAEIIVRLAGECRTPPLARLVNATNLIEKTPALRDTLSQYNSTGSIDLSNLDPETASRLNDLTRQMSKGEYANLNELLEAVRNNPKAQEELRRRLPQPGDAR